MIRVEETSFAKTNSLHPRRLNSPPSPRPIPQSSIVHPHLDTPMDLHSRLLMRYDSRSAKVQRNILVPVPLLILRRVSNGQKLDQPPQRHFLESVVDGACEIALLDIGRGERRGCAGGCCSWGVTFYGSVRIFAIDSGVDDIGIQGVWVDTKLCEGVGVVHNSCVG